MNARALIPLVAGLAIGGLALKMGLDTLRSAKGAQQSVEKSHVWAANQDILRGEEVTDEMVKEVAFPTALMPQGAAKEKKEIVGRVCTLDMPANLPILEQNLLPAGQRLGLQVKPGYRAVSVKIDEGSGVDYHLEPGSYVDVIGSFTVQRDNRRQETVATTIIENAEVAAVGERINPTTGKDEEDAGSSKRKVRAVTLYVKPEDVPKLHITEQKGRIKLALRGNTDDSRLSVQDWESDARLTGETQDETPAPKSDIVLAAAQSPAPAPRPRVENWTVDIYRGDSEKKEEIVFQRTLPGVPDETPAQPSAPAELIPGLNLFNGPASGVAKPAGQPNSSVSSFLWSVLTRMEPSPAKPSTPKPPMAVPEGAAPPPSPEELAQEGPCQPIEFEEHPE